MAAELNEVTYESERSPPVTLSVRTLYEQYQRPLLAWLRQRLSVASDADDVAQETWIRLMRYEGASDIASPKSMLYTVAAHVACDQERMRRARHGAQHASIDDEEHELPAHQPSIEQIVESAEAYRNVCRKIEQLPPKCRRVFLLSRMHGMTYPQIAQHCEISVKMVEKHISHALLVLLKG
ncbi:MAG TPA: RNA polymerase sigma factor [Pseudomonadales bacterium]